MVTHQSKHFENRNISFIELSFIEVSFIEHPKTSHKLSKTIRQAEKVGPNNSLYSLYSDTKKVNIF